MSGTLVNITLNIPPSFAWQNAKWWQNATMRAAIFARFWSQVNSRKANECWLWTGLVLSHGYGQFYVASNPRIRYSAHRFAWLFSRGEIPTGCEVCHSCDNTRCVNPDHLFLGTHRDNHLDSVRKGRKRAWGLQKLNAAQVIDIRTQCAAGARQLDVGRAFGIARNTVSQIVNRKTWAHLHG